MKRIKAFIWSMNDYKQGSQEVQKSWRNVQIVFELGRDLMKILKIPAKKCNSMHTAFWVSGNRKVLRTLIPDEVIKDSCEVELGLTEKNSSVGSSYISGTYGLEIVEYEAYKKEDSEVRDFKITEDHAKDNNHYIGKYYRYHGSVQSYISSVVIQSNEEVNISNQAKLYLSCMIGRDFLWDGRKYKFKVMQYTKEEAEKEKQELLALQVSWVDILCDYFNVPKDLPILDTIREMLSREPKDYE